MSQVQCSIWCLRLSQVLKYLYSSQIFIGILNKYSSVFFTNTIFLLCLMNIIPPQALPFVSDPNKNKKEEAVLTGFSLEWMS